MLIFPWNLEPSSSWKTVWPLPLACCRTRLAVESPRTVEMTPLITLSVWDTVTTESSATVSRLFSRATFWIKPPLW